MSGIGKLIDVCETYGNMTQLTQGTLYLLSHDQMPPSDVARFERGDILWFLREVLQLLELEQDVVRTEIEELRTKLEEVSAL